MVLQKNTLFSGTIKDNLRWGDANATDEEMRSACRIACAEEFIEKMPDGYDTYIEQGGTNVSGGQKQRLCIARAILRKPKVLIPDDSTSAVDTATAAAIRQGLRSTLPGTTTVLRAGCGHHRGAGRRNDFRRGQPCGAAENQRNLQRSI